MNKSEVYDLRVNLYNLCGRPDPSYLELFTNVLR